MRSITKMTSEPNLYRSKFTGNKPFYPIKRSSAHSGPSMSHKLSSKVKRLLSEDLNKRCPLSSSASSSASSSLSSYTGGVHANSSFVCGDDASIQSTNSRRRKFQRRGSKSASMFKYFSLEAFSASNFSIPEVLFEGTDDLPAQECIPEVSERSIMSGLGDSTNTLSLEEISEEFGCSSYDLPC